MNGRSWAYFMYKISPLSSFQYRRAAIQILQQALFSDLHRAGWGTFRDSDSTSARCALLWPVLRSSNAFARSFVRPRAVDLLWELPISGSLWHWRFRRRSISEGSFALSAWKAYEKLLISFFMWSISLWEVIGKMHLIISAIHKHFSVQLLITLAISSDLWANLADSDFFPKPYQRICQVSDLCMLFRALHDWPSSQLWHRCPLLVWRCVPAGLLCKRDWHLPVADA